MKNPFRNRYRVTRDDSEYLRVEFRKWFMFRWECVSHARDLDVAKRMIEKHRNPVVHEE